METNASEILIGFAEIAVALAGFTGVVVAFGSRKHGQWHPGDRLRLSFLLESSLTAGGFALLTVVLLDVYPPPSVVAWVAASIAWAVFMPFSLYSSHLRVKKNRREHGDIDSLSNRLVFAIFLGLIFVQIGNAGVWMHSAPLLAAISFNLAGSAMQFARLIRSAFHD